MLFSALSAAKGMVINMKKIVIVIFLIMIAIYSSIFMNTNSIKKDVIQVLSGEVDPEITVGRPMNKYNSKASLSYLIPDERTKANVRIARLFVLHNFFNGYMWVRYTCEITSEDGTRIMGAWNVPAHWKIHRQNGKWEIVEIIEKP